MSNREIGYIYEVVNPNATGGYYEKGDIVVLVNYRHDSASGYKTIKTSRDGVEDFCMYNSELKQLWPVPDEEVEAPKETIELMGKTYIKEDIESALSTITEVN